MNSQLFKINQEELKKAGIKAILVLLGIIATFLQVDLFNIVEVPSTILPFLIAINTALVDIIRKFIKSEEGKYFGKF